MRKILEVAGLCCAIVVLSQAFSCGIAGRAPEPEYRVYNAVLFEMCRDLRTDLITTIVMLEDTYVRDREHLTDWLSRVTVHLPDVESSTLRSFTSRNMASARLRDEFDSCVPITLISEEKLDSFRAGDEEFRRQLKAAYPGSVGVMRLSRVGFNEAGTQALLYLETGFSGDLILFVLEGDQWTFGTPSRLWVN